MQAAQELAGAKTMTELFEKQTAYAQSAFEGLMQQTTKMNEIYSAAAKDISAPLGARVTAATETRVIKPRVSALRSADGCLTAR